MVKNTEKGKKVITKRQGDKRTLEPYITEMEGKSMESQSVILRKKEGNRVSKVNEAMTPENVFLNAYKQVNALINTESMDYLQSVAESILTKLQAKDFNASAWEFKTIDNMATYIKGSINRKQIKTKQAHAQALKDSLDDAYADIPDYKRIPRVDLYDDIRGAKKKGTKKDLFTKEEKELITAYLEEEETIRDIAKETGQTRMKVQRQLESISKRIAKLPIRGLYGFIESDGVPGKVHCEDQKSKPLVTRIGLLRRYRRTKDMVWLDKYNDNSERVLTEHECRIACPGDKTRCFEPGGQLQVSKARGLRVTLQARQKSNQEIIDLIMPGGGNWTFNHQNNNRKALQGILRPNEVLCLKEDKVCPFAKFNLVHGQQPSSYSVMVYGGYTSL